MTSHGFKPMASITTNHQNLDAVGMTNIITPYFNAGHEI